MEQFNFGPAKTQISTATQSSDGLMSLSDKTKLDGIQTGAQVNPGNATTSADGLMSAGDKTKLDGIASEANKTVVSDSLADDSTTNALSAAKGKALNDSITTLNSNVAKKANVQKDSILGGSSVTITITTPCLVIVGRASASTQTTTAFIDGWSAPVYISNNATFTLSASGSSLTITNTSGGYTSYIVIS